MRSLWYSRRVQIPDASSNRSQRLVAGLRLTSLRSAAVALAGVCMFAGPARAVDVTDPTTDCPSSYDFSISVDYKDPQWQVKIHNIEAHHFNADVENLVRGQSMTAVGGDIQFLLRYVPNHHRGLYALVKLALRDKTEMPNATNPYTVRCWLQRAEIFNPEDGTVFLISGVYLGRLGRIDEAIVALRRADELLPNDENVQYNLGLLYFDKKDYARSLDFAKRAYAGGFPLPGLRRKLEQVGQWRE